MGEDPVHFVWWHSWSADPGVQEVATGRVLRRAAWLLAKVLPPLPALSQCLVFSDGVGLENLKVK